MAQIPQARNYGIPALDYSGVSNTLAALGQQIGQGLAMREYQRQYQNTLPAIEQTMRSATQKIQAGDFTGGYAEAVGGLPLMSQNPLIAQASKSYLDSIKNVAEFQQNQMWNDLQRSRMGGGTGTGGTGLPAVGGVARTIIGNDNPDVNNRDFNTPVDEMEAVEVALPTNAPSAIVTVPQEATVAPSATPAATPAPAAPTDQTGRRGIPLPEGFLDEQLQGKPEEVQNAFRNSVPVIQQYAQSSPQEQVKMRDMSVITQKQFQDGKTSGLFEKYDTIPNLGKYINAEGWEAVGVPIAAKGVKVNKQATVRDFVSNGAIGQLGTMQTSTSEDTALKTNSQENYTLLARKIATLDSYGEFQKVLKEAGSIYNIGIRSADDQTSEFYALDNPEVSFRIPSGKSGESLLEAFEIVKTAPIANAGIGIPFVAKFRGEQPRPPRVQKIANPDPKKFRKGDIVEQGGIQYEIE
jgi:hypothetical protein